MERASSADRFEERSKIQSQGDDQTASIEPITEVKVNAEDPDVNNN